MDYARVCVRVGGAVVPEGVLMVEGVAPES